MDKRREIPVATNPNAPPRESVEAAQKRIERLGLDWHEVAEAAGVSYSVGYNLLRGGGSLGSLRKIEDWLSREETKNVAQKPQERVSQLEEWAALGHELQELDASEFESTLDGLRDLVEAVKLKSSGIRKMFRANPDRPR